MSDIFEVGATHIDHTIDQLSAAGMMPVKSAAALCVGDGAEDHRRQLVGLFDDIAAAGSVATLPHRVGAADFIAAEIDFDLAAVDLLLSRLRPAGALALRLRHLWRWREAPLGALLRRHDVEEFQIIRPGMVIGRRQPLVTPGRLRQPPGMSLQSRLQP